MRLSRLLARAAAGAILYSACAPPGRAPEPSLTVAVQADVTGLYPILRNESYTFALNTNLFEGLTRLGRDLSLEPAVADRWECPDETTWLFHIRPGLRFSNGSPVLVGDVVASIRFAARLDATEYLLAPIEGVDEVPPDQVRIRTKFPFPVLLAHLAGAFILPAAALQQRPVPPVGTGPFKLEAWQRGQELDLVPNPFFRGGGPGFSRVRLLVTPDGGERVRAVLSGQADVIDSVPLDEIPHLRRRENLKVVVRPSLRVLFLVLPMDEPHFANPLVRQAFDLAIDRSEVVARALNGFGTVASELVPAGVLGYNPRLRPVRPDRTRARELLRAAGYPGGFAIRLHGPRDRYTNGVEIMGEVARELAEIGVRVEVEALPKEEFFALTDSPRGHFLLFGWSCETVQAGELLDEVVHTPHEAASRNLAAFSDLGLDRLIETADQTASLSDRAELLAEALKRVAEIRAFLPLVTQNESFAFSRLIDWDPSLDMALRIPEMRRRAVP